MEATLRRTMMSVTDTIFPVSKSAKDPQKHQMLKAGILYCINFHGCLTQKCDQNASFQCFEKCRFGLETESPFLHKDLFLHGNSLREAV